jgi:DNA-binding transcriptional regulator YiaG
MNDQDVKKMRDALHLTQEQFAQLMGVTLGTVNRWEKGRVKPSSLAIYKMTAIMKQKKVSL